MKQLVVVCTILCLAAWGVSVNVGIAADPGPETILFKKGPGKVSFPHRDHQALQKSECFHCHKPDTYKIVVWGEEPAHTQCISCHDLNDKGPVKCEECHKK
jgi:cytochrome c553